MYIATLTGSCVRALGFETAGFFSNDEDFAKQIWDAQESSFEPCWRLPINDEFRKSVKSNIGADLTNCPDRSQWGGASIAAAFLEAFIEDNRPFAHLDIAGATLSTGAGGFGTKVLLHIVKNI